MRTSWPGDGDDNRAISEAEGKLESAFVLYFETILTAEPQNFHFDEY